MPSKQYELCALVLKRLRDAGVLESLVLVGSWCMVLYRAYFHDVGRVDAVRSRDMDFLVPPSVRFRNTVRVPELLHDLGFLQSFRGTEGFMMLEHPELMIEFLVPERGRGISRAKDLPELGMNAQALRYMDIPMMKTIRLNFEDVEVVAPHPAAFALHKLLVAPRREKAEKKRKDMDQAISLLELLLKKREIEVACDLMGQFPRPWRKAILHVLETDGQHDLATRITV